MIGYITLVLTALLVELSILLYLTGMKQKNIKHFGYADYSVLGVCVLLTFAIGVLLFQLVTHDFQNIYVAQNTSKELPILYIISAVWAGQNGSLLFWAWLISLANAYIVVKNKDNEFQPYVSTILSGIQMFFQFLLLFASNPFARYSTVPLDGMGLNPLLQDPGMIIHPPTLFIGYTALMVPYAYAMAGLLKEDDTWVTKVRGWNILAWIFLTLGIALGAWWAYHMLGWGGYWAWDPIENSSLMPWLILTAFLHSIMIQEGKRGMKVWNVFLPLFAFVLVIYATFLTRSGIIQSIHSFSESSIGFYFIGFIVLTTLASVGLIAYRYEKLKSRNIFEDYVSKETSFLFNNLLFTILTLLILLGTTFPLLSEALRGYQVRVGPGYFNETFSPLAIILVLLMGLCPLVAWRKASFDSLRKNLQYPILVTVLLSAISFALGVSRVRALLVVSVVSFNLGSIVQEFYRTTEPDSGKPLMARLNLLFSSVRNNQRRYGGYIIHLSMVLLLVGIASSSIYEESAMVTLGIDEGFEMMDYRFVLKDITDLEGDGKHINQVQVDIFSNGQLVYQALPAIDYYYSMEQNVIRPHIQNVWMTDIYVIYEFSNQGRATFTFKVIPNVGFIWISIIVGIIGTLIAVWPNKKSVLGREL